MSELVLVDDEPRVTSALTRELLWEYGSQNFTIVAFQDPQRCLEYVRDHKASVFLVISDLRMPTMSGARLLEEIRQVSSEIQTVLLTAFADLPEIQRAISSSLQGLAFKPWSIESLRVEVDKAWNLAQLRAENRRLSRELDGMLWAAGEFQRTLFQSSASDALAPVSPRIEIAHRAAERVHCSGDYYEVYSHRNHTATILLADVSGHGPKSALVTILLKTMFQDLRTQHPDLDRHLEDLVGAANRRLCELLAPTPEILVALVAVQVDYPGQTLKVVNAGQPPVCLLGETGIRRSVATNMAVGVDPRVQFSSETLAMNADDRVVFFTDGLVDVPQYGLPESSAYLDVLLLSSSWKGASDLVDHAIQTMPRRTLADDVTVIVVQN